MKKSSRQLHNNLRYYRKLWKYSLKDIAFLLDFKSTSIISRWESGKDRPNMDNLYSLAYIFRVPTEALFDEHRKALRVAIHKRELILQARKDKSQ